MRIGRIDLLNSSVSGYRAPNLPASEEISEAHLSTITDLLHANKETCQFWIAPFDEETDSDGIDERLEIDPLWVTTRTYTSTGTTVPYKQEDIDPSKVIIGGIRTQSVRNISSVWLKPYFNLSLFENPDLSGYQSNGWHTINQEWIDVNGTVHDYYTAYVIVNLTENNFDNNNQTLTDIAASGNYDGQSIDAVMVAGNDAYLFDRFQRDVQWKVDKWFDSDIRSEAGNDSIDYLINGPKYSLYGERTARLHGNAINIIKYLLKPAWIERQPTMTWKLYTKNTGFSSGKVWREGNFKFHTYYTEHVNPYTSNKMVARQEMVWMKTRPLSTNEFTPNSRLANAIGYGAAVFTIGMTIYVASEDIEEIQDGNYIFIPKLMADVGSGVFFTASILSTTDFGINVARSLHWFQNVKPGTVGEFQQAKNLGARAMGYGFILLAAVETGFFIGALITGDYDAAKEFGKNAIAFSIDAAGCFVPGFNIFWAGAEAITFGVTGLLTLGGILDHPYTIGQIIVFADDFWDDLWN